MPRIVRHRQPTIQSHAKDALLALHERFEVVDLDEVSRTWVVPMGVVLNLVYWLCCYRVFMSQSSPDVVFESRGGGSAMPTRWVTRWASTTLFFMTLASFLNVYYLLSRRRTYHVQAPAAVSLPGSPDDRPSSSAAKAMVIWEPSLPSLRLFSILSPLHLFITWQLCLSPYLLFTLLALSATLLGALHLFMQHVQHKQRLYGHVFSEYDRTFVEPRLNIMKRDVGCGTSPDEQGVYVEVHTPKVGILDSRRERGIPKSASMVRMHDWEQTTGGDLPSTPVLWRQQPQLSGISSPAKGMSALQSPVRRGRSPMKPAGWRSSAPGAIGSPAPVFAGGVLGTQRKPRTVPSQLRDE